MYQTILVPLDGSIRAEKVLKHVEQLALSTGAKVILIRVVSPPKITGFEESPPEYFQKQLDDRIGAAEKYVDDLKGQLKEKAIEATSQVVFGSVVKEILDAAEREKADLIAMCSHGRSGMLAFRFNEDQGSIGYVNVPACGLLGPVLAHLR